MASFLIDTSAVAVTGSDEGDTFQIISGGNAITVEALAGDDTVEQSGTAGVLTDSFFYLREGDDALEISTGGLTNSFVGGSLGDDTITYSGGTALVGTTLNGGQGEDLISAGIGTSASAFSINGGRDDDTVAVSAGAADNGFIGAGKGDDLITAGIDTINNVSIAAGLGEDEISGDFNTAGGLVINGGGNGTDGSLDSGDDIGLDFDEVDGGLTVVGNGGDDTINIFIDSAASAVSINGNLGDDTIFVSAGTANGVVVGGGKGDDSIALDTNEVSGGATVNGGAGEDLLIYTGGSAGALVNGGADADTIEVTATAGLGISEFSESTFTDRDLVIFADTDESAGAVTISTIGGLGVADGTAGSAGGTDIVVTGGLATGFATAGLDLTAAVAFLSDNLDTKEAAAFSVSAGENFVFVKGTDNDLVIEFDTTAGTTAGLSVASTTQGSDIEIAFS